MDSRPSGQHNDPGKELRRSSREADRFYKSLRSKTVSRKLILKFLSFVTIVTLFLSALAPSSVVANIHTDAAFTSYLPLLINQLPPIIPSTTKVVSGAAATNLVAVSPDTRLLTFKKSSNQPLDIKPGEVIASAPTPLLPYGLLRKVVTVTTVQNQLVVETTSATLDEALQQGELHVTQVLSPSQTTRAEIGNGVVVTERSPQTQAATVYFEIKDVVLYDDDGNSNTTNDQVLANGSIEVTPILNFDMQVKDFQLKHLYFAVDTQEKVKIEIESKITLVKLKKEKELARYPLTPITVFVGLLPVVFTPILLLTVGVDGDVHVSLKTSVTQEASLKGGMQYSNGTWGPVSQYTNQFQYQPPTLSAGGELKGYAGPRFQILLYGVVGPQIKIDGYVKLEADTAETPWWKLYGGLDLSAEFRMGILSRKIASYTIPGVIGIKVLLAQASTSIPPPVQGLTYTSGGQVFEVNLASGITTPRGAAPPSGIVEGKDRLFWIETSSDSFRILQANLDGSNESVVLTGEDFYARISDSEYGPFTWGPSTLSVNNDQTLLFFDAGVEVAPGAVCYVITLDLRTKALANTNFWCGLNSSPSIAPDGDRVTGSMRAAYPGWEGWINPTYLFHRQGTENKLNYALPLDTRWLSDGRIVYSVSIASGNAGTPPDLVNEGRKITLADASGNTIRDLDTNVFAGSLAISPDQQQLAYIAVDSQSYQPQALWLVNLDGTGKRKLADIPNDARDLAWR